MILRLRVCRTGCGKTLAFVLPIIEKLQASAGTSRPHGRHVSVIVLAPTRELAKQVGLPSACSHILYAW